jgi:hypothetical protein
MCRIDEKKQKRKRRKIIKKNNKMRRVGGKYTEVKGTVSPD